jgi:hypothetical protein
MVGEDNGEYVRYDEAGCDDEEEDEEDSEGA